MMSLARTSRYIVILKAKKYFWILWYYIWSKTTLLIAIDTIRIILTCIYFYFYLFIIIIFYLNVLIFKFIIINYLFSYYFIFYYFYWQTRLLWTFSFNCSVTFWCFISIWFQDNTIKVDTPLLAKCYFCTQIVFANSVFWRFSYVTFLTTAIKTEIRWFAVQFVCEISKYLFK